jgi:hypothetical protein
MEISHEEYERKFAAAQKDEEYYFIKANIPSSLEEHARGNGEGIWVIVDTPTKQAYDSFQGQGTFMAYAANPIFTSPAVQARTFNPELRTYKPLEFEYRGNKRPILARHILEEVLRRN